MTLGQLEDEIEKLKLSNPNPLTRDIIVTISDLGLRDYDITYIGVSPLKRTGLYLGVCER